jgi:aryl-alcohol dehydrogenase-like predicted oxidoreductase
LKYRRLGTTDLTLSEIGLGCQSLGGGLHHAGKRAASALIASALDAGITFFDTADHYSLGQSEELLGRALREVRDRVVIGTKIGTFYTPAARALLSLRPAVRSFGRWLLPIKQDLDRLRSTQRRGDFSLPYLRRAVEDSLRRLRTDYIDLVQLHKPPAHLLRNGDVGEVVDALLRDGSVRYVGVSCETIDDAFACLDIAGLASVQLTINLLELQAADRFLSAAQDSGIGVIARNPRAAGLLTASFGDVTAETYALDRSEYELSRSNARRFAFLDVPGRSLAQAAIRYVLQLPGVHAAIPRALDERELSEAVGAGAIPCLAPEELEQIALIGRQLPGRAKRYSYRPATPRVVP